MSHNSSTRLKSARVIHILSQKAHSRNWLFIDRQVMGSESTSYTITINYSYRHYSYKLLHLRIQYPLFTNPRQSFIEIRAEESLIT